MSDIVALPKEEWDNLKHEIAVIKDAILGTVDGDKMGIVRRLDKMDHETRQSLRGMETELQEVKRRLAHLEDGRQWLNRIVGGGLVSLALSAIFAAIQMWGKH